MANILVRKKIEIPMIGTWEWSKDDYKIPLVFHLSGVKTLLYLDVWDAGLRQRDVTWDAVLEFHFESASRSVIRGLTTSGKQAMEVASKIYDYYLTIHERFESLLYTVGKTQSMLPATPQSFENFFADDLPFEDSVTFEIDSGPPLKFSPKLTSNRKKIRPVFKRAQLIDKIKWQRMQEAINAQDFGSPEIIELFRIRSKLEWRERKIATIEAAIFAETALREFIVRALISRGISKKKLKDIQNDLSFSILLNALLPMAIPKVKAEKLRSHIAAVDLLRKVRNDLVHGNITEKGIDERKVREGIDGTLRIVETIQSSLKR